MIVGNGLIARGFQNFSNKDNILLFASGVSNSQEVDTLKFVREIELFEKHVAQIENKTLIYFSTCSIEDIENNRTEYVKHKIMIENRIKKLNNYYIFRLPQVVGSSQNNSQLFNFLFHAIDKEINFTLFKDAYRNFIDIDDVVNIVNKIVENKVLKNSIVNIANMYPISIVDAVINIEKFLGKKGKYEIVERGCRYDINIDKILIILQELEINFGYNYFENLLKKYKQGI